MVPEYDYDNLDGVKDGGMAMDAYAKAIDPDTLRDEKQLIKQQLLQYCEMDTQAMVQIFYYLQSSDLTSDF